MVSPRVCVCSGLLTYYSLWYLHVCVSAGRLPTNYSLWYLHVCVSAGGLPTNYCLWYLHVCVCPLVDFQPTTVYGISTCVCLLWTSNQLHSMVSPRVCVCCGLPTNYSLWYLHVCVSAGGLPTNYSLWYLHVCVSAVDFQPTTVYGISTCVCLLVDFQPTTVYGISTCVCLQWTSNLLQSMVSPRVCVCW